MLYEVYDINNLVLVAKQSKLVSVVEITDIITYPHEMNKLLNIYITGRGGRIHVV